MNIVIDCERQQEFSFPFVRMNERLDVRNFSVNECVSACKLQTRKRCPVMDLMVISLTDELYTMLRSTLFI